MYAKKDQENIDKRYSKNEWKYSALRPVYSICILVENEFEDTNPIHTFHLYDKEHDLSYKSRYDEELITMVFLELEKSSGKVDKNIKEWFEYFRTGEVSEDAPKYMQQACEVASCHNLEREEMDMISAREKAEQDALAREHYVWMQGKEDGKAEGKAEGMLIIIQRMLARGDSMDEIEEITGLSKDAIEKLKK